MTKKREAGATPRQHDEAFQPLLDPMIAAHQAVRSDEGTGLFQGGAETERSDGMILDVDGRWRGTDLRTVAEVA